jgi:hypothetical protein
MCCTKKISLVFMTWDIFLPHATLALGYYFEGKFYHGFVVDQCRDLRSTRGIVARVRAAKPQDVQ